MSVAELQAMLLGTESMDGFLPDVASLAARELGEGLSCGITSQPHGRPPTVASSDVNAAQIDELQYGPGDGPCLTALRTGTLVRIDDLASDQRWSDYAPSTRLAATARCFQSGVVNGYVTWTVLGLACLGAVLGLTIR